MVIAFLCILAFLVGWIVSHRKIRRRKRVDALIREVVLAHLSGDTARMDQASAGLKDLGITLVGIERISYDE